MDARRSRYRTRPHSYFVAFSEEGHLEHRWKLGRSRGSAGWSAHNQPQAKRSAGFHPRNAKIVRRQRLDRLTHDSELHEALGRSRDRVLARPRLPFEHPLGLRAGDVANVAEQRSAPPSAAMKSQATRSPIA